MRAHHIIAVLVVLFIGLGAKQFFSPPHKALADVNPVTNSSMNVLQMNIDHPIVSNLPVQMTHDMEAVFADGD